MPKKVIISFFLLLLILIMSAVGMYYYYQYKSQQIVNSTIAQLAGIALIEVNETVVDFDGNIYLNQVDISPNGYIDKVAIDRIIIKTGGPFNILSKEILKDIDSGYLELVVSGVVFDLNSDYIKERSMLYHDLRGRPLWNVACADQPGFLTLMDNAGLAHNQLDALVTMSLGANERSLNLSVSVNLQGALTALLETQLVTQSPIDLTDNSLLRRAKLSYASLNINDKGINNKRLKYCADQEDVPLDSYSNYFKEHVKLRLLTNEDVNNSVLEASVLNLFTPKVKAMLRLKPKFPLSLVTIFSDDYDFLNSKSLELSVNGQLASTEYLSLLRGVEIVEDQADVVKDDILAEIEEQKAIRARQSKPMAYLDIAMADVGEFTNKLVRIRTVLGKEIDGVISDVQEDKIILSRRMAHGFVKYPVLKKNIATLKSFR